MKQKKKPPKSDSIKKNVKLNRKMHDDFLKIASKKQHDFNKRVRWLIQKDIEENNHLLIN